MGYTWVMFGSTILLSPIALVGALALLWLARKLNLVPRKGGAVVGYLLILFAGYGVLYLGVTVQSLVVTPARLQQDYLGARVAGPLALVGFEAGGFQDPYQIWRYSLSDAQAESLRERCSWNEFARGERTCTLYSAMTDRWAAGVTLEWNELVIEDGLH